MKFIFGESLQQLWIVESFIKFFPKKLVYQGQLGLLQQNIPLYIFFLCSSANFTPKYLIATLKKIPSPSPSNIGSCFPSEKPLQKLPKAWRGHITILP